MIRLNFKHLRILQKSYNESDRDPNYSFGKNARNFGEKHLKNSPSQLNYLPNSRIKRFDVFDLTRNRNVKTRTVCLAILGWGGIKYPHRDLLFNSHQMEWLDIAEEIRNGRLDRVKAYQHLSQLRKTGNLQGAGPAFFTKLGRVNTNTPICGILQSSRL